MNIIEICGIGKSYPKQIEGTADWYYSKESRDTLCDLYDAEEIIKSGEKFPGMNVHLVHFPDGVVHSPYKLRENLYVDTPVWDNGKIYFLSIDFNDNLIRIGTYYPEEKRVETIKVLLLGIVKDCYNLSLKASPIMLSRQGNEGVFEIVWPENKTIPIGKTESLLFRSGEVLYFSKWYENPEYNESVIVRDVNTGSIKDEFNGYLVKLPNGVYWRI